MTILQEFNQEGTKAVLTCFLTPYLHYVLVYYL